MAEKIHEHETSFVGRLFEKAKHLPNTVPQAIRQELADLSASINGENDKLKANKNPEEGLKELKNKARTTSQKYAREMGVGKLKENKKFEKLLANSAGFDSLRAGEVLRMRSAGEDISKLLLTDEDGEEVLSLSQNIETYKNKTLLVNFGDKNNSINASIGLGDILPYEAKKVKVIDDKGNEVIGTLGYQDSRKGRRERVGYYDESGKYIAIYRNYKIQILETGTVSEDEKKKFSTLQDEFTKNLRIKEMSEYYFSKSGLKKTTTEEVSTILSSEFSDDTDKSLYALVAESINTRIIRGEHIREAYKDGIGSRDKFIGKFGWYLRDVIGKDFPNIPPHILVNLFDKESDPRGSFDPTARNGNTGAYGLGQITPTTWNEILEKSRLNLNIDNPYDQIYASTWYISNIKRNNNCDIKDAIVYYHTGPNIKSSFIDKNDISALNRYKDSNKQIAQLMTEDSWAGYMQAARYYYTEEPTLLSSLDLSKTGTELASKLGDYVMSTTLPNTGNSSCGQAVGILLNRFGIEALPQSGRDGKNWDDILEPRVQQGQFKKVPIKHPSEAGAGAILVYDGSGLLGSDANKLYGHVEIKGSDGNFYSYYEGMKSGGSAANNENDPEKYRKLTGFTGYAYYPVSRDI